MTPLFVRFFAAVTRKKRSFISREEHLPFSSAAHNSGNSPRNPGYSPVRLKIEVEKWPPVCSHLFRRVVPMFDPKFDAGVYEK